MSIPTQKELLETQRKQLDERYAQKYPNGKFVLQQFHGWHIHWCPKRNTGATHRKGITERYWNDGQHDEKGYRSHSECYQNNSFGKCNNYDSFDKLMAACKKQGCPEELVKKFTERYQARQSEGFKI